MASGRVRRDSETSTDSWSLVEEDHLGDDISVHSTDVDEEIENEPIVEEPPTSDEDDTASENSDSDSDSDLSDSESESESDSDMEKAHSEELTASEDENEEEEEEDSDLEVQIQEEKEEEEEDEEEGEEMSEEEKEAVRKCKEEDWYDDEEEEEEHPKQGDEHSAQSLASCIAFVIASLLMFAFFAVADRYSEHMFRQEVVGESGPFEFPFYSPQSYSRDQVSGFGVEEEKPPVKYDYRGRPLETLENKLRDHDAKEKKETESLRGPFRLMDEHGQISEYFFKMAGMREVPPTQNYSAEFLKQIPNTPKVFNNYSSSELQPIPPAPFTPRRQQKLVVPRHQPCLVHVNESKWTCQKNVPMIYKGSQLQKWKTSGRTGAARVVKKEICGKKASESMRTASKPTDQCDTRHFAKYTPRRKHIAFKTPLPCKAPNYKPSHPKPTKKPSQSSEDWYSKRTQMRAQLRSRA